ncbi:MAG: hypothetical protein KF716_25280 [Anaerolineae bacterium]|nr:hypothetical protein [Anaerolineae bacterium]
MSTLQSTQAGIQTSSRVDGRPAGSLRFDLVAALLSAGFIIGIFIDGWAHNHGRVDNTFFTPWHAVLYGSVLAIAAHLSLTQTRNMLKGYAWSKSLPIGYGWSLIGVGVFFAAGGFDFLWHGWFGFEANLGLLLSPAHFALGTGAFLFLTGPIRAALKRRDALSSWREVLPAMLSITFVLSLLTFFTMYMNGWGNIRNIASTSTPGNGDLVQIMAIASVLFQTAATMGLILLAMRWWKLPFGAITLVLTLNAALMLWVRWGWINQYILVMLAAPIAGLLGDVLLRVLKPSAERPNQVRLFSVGLPFMLFAVYFAILIPSYGTWWTVHMWTGIIFMASVVGLFISYLVFPYGSEGDAHA